MLLRRVIEHVKAQNWTAVALDFVIVVVGVFIGIQVSNWNDARADREAYRLAHLRLGAEIDANLEAIAAAKLELEESIPRVTHAIESLRNCDAGPDAEAAIAEGVNEVQLTRGIRFRMSALKELTEDATLLGQQSESERRSFQDLRYNLEVWQFEADFTEILPFDEPVWRQSGLVVGPLEIFKQTYRGVEWTLPTRTLALATPADEACKDETLIAKLYGWERMQSALETLFAIATVELTEARAAIADSAGEVD